MKEAIGYVYKRVVPFLLPLIVVLLSGFILASPSSFSASTTANASVTVGSACTMTATVDTPHNAEVPNGTNRTEIGTTTLNTICNDSGGFAIYAVGYSNNEYGNNTMINQADSNITFNTGTATSGSNSNWSMKLSQVTTGTFATTIDNSFNNYHNVPNTYTKVAHRDSATDAVSANPATGTSISATYQTFISPTQAAGTYQGKVKYTMVHPANKTPGDAPISCTANKICYSPNANNTEGTMGQQEATGNNTEVMLLASNFSREGYGFAGWSEDQNAADHLSTATIYGPNETITTKSDHSTNGLSLYAIWVPSAGTIQNWTGCSGLASGAVTALTDQRDNQTYAVAKLADGKCWMIENLRLESTNSDNTTGTLAQGYGGQFAGLATAESAWANNITTANSLYSTDGADSTINIGTSNAGYRFPRYNHDNTNSRASSPTANDTAMYSYGNYYTWAAAIADTTAYTTNNQSVENYSICPSGWHLPIGGRKANVDVSEFWKLSRATIGADPANFANDDFSYTGTPEGTDASNKMRAYPNNFVYSGNTGSGSVISRGSTGYYWSSTALSSINAYYLYLYSSSVRPGTDFSYKYRGRPVRCVVSGA